MAQESCRTATFLRLTVNGEACVRSVGRSESAWANIINLHIRGLRCACKALTKIADFISASARLAALLAAITPQRCRRAHQIKAIGWACSSNSCLAAARSQDDSVMRSVRSSAATFVTAAQGVSSRFCRRATGLELNAVFGWCRCAHNSPGAMRNTCRLSKPRAKSFRGAVSDHQNQSFARPQHRFTIGQQEAGYAQQRSGARFGRHSIETRSHCADLMNRPGRKAVVKQSLGPGPPWVLSSVNGDDSGTAACSDPSAGFSPI